MLTYVGSGTGTGFQPAASAGDAALLGLAVEPQGLLGGRPARLLGGPLLGQLAAHRHQPVQRVEAHDPGPDAAPDGLRVRVTSRLRRTCTRRWTRSATVSTSSSTGAHHGTGVNGASTAVSTRHEHQAGQDPAAAHGGRPDPRPADRGGALGRDAGCGSAGCWEPAPAWAA